MYFNLKTDYSNFLIYRCLICGDVFENPRQLEAHLQKAHKMGIKKPTPRGLDVWCD